jgi:hypothetical protein
MFDATMELLIKFKVGLGYWKKGRGIKRVLKRRARV